MSAFRIGDERLQLDRSAYTAARTTSNDESVSQALTTVDLNQHDNGVSTNDFQTPKKDDGAGLHATLKRSALHKCFSIIFDIPMSLVPLFFLGMSQLR
jgi:hypothetical protein